MWKMWGVNLGGARALTHVTSGIITVLVKIILGAGCPHLPRLVFDFVSTVYKGKRVNKGLERVYTYFYAITSGGKCRALQFCVVLQRIYAVRVARVVEGEFRRRRSDESGGFTEHTYVHTHTLEWAFPKEGTYSTFISSCVKGWCGVNRRAPCCVVLSALLFVLGKRVAAAGQFQVQ